jgi:uncharacterized membrane-anchored protein
MTRKILYAVLAAQLLVLSGLYAYYSAGLGFPVYRLRTVPVDPRDLLRGDYVILRYEISRLPEGANQKNLGPTVWVKLKPDGNAWTIDRVGNYQEKSETESDRPTLRAQRNGSELVYDLERYYVPEGTGRSAPPGGKLIVEVAVRGNGSAQIKRLLDESGNPWPK